MTSPLSPLALPCRCTGGLARQCENEENTPLINDMTDGSPLVHISIPSRILGDLIKAFICRHCHGNCVLTENRAPGQIAGKKVFVICDWQDFVTNHALPPEPSSDTSFHIVINTLKGEEKELVYSHDVWKIRGLFYADDSLETFGKGFTTILNDEVWVPRTVLMSWMSVADMTKMARCRKVLSSREMVILKQIVSGRSNKEISRELRISAHTVKAHLYNIFKKIEVSSRAEAARWASDLMSESVWNIGDTNESNLE